MKTAYVSTAAILPWLISIWGCSVVGGDLEPLEVEDESPPRQASEFVPTPATRPVSGGQPSTASPLLPVETRATPSSVPDLEGINLIENSDAESGLDGWTADFGGTLELTTEQARSGAFSVLLSQRTQSYHGIHRDVTAQVTPGEPYAVRTFALLRGTSLAPVQLTAHVQCEGQPDVYSWVASASGSNARWQALDGVFEMPARNECTPRHVSVYVEGPPPGIDLFVDDVQMVGQSPRFQNLVQSSDFETGLEGWSAPFGGELSTVTEPVLGGERSLRTTERTFEFQGPYHDLTDAVRPGSTYFGRAFALHSGEEEAPLVLTARIECAGSPESFGRIAQRTTVGFEWVELAGELSVPGPEECDLERFLLYVEGPEPGVDLFVDDVVFGLAGATLVAPIDERVENGDFELGSLGWTAAFGGTLATETGVAHGGASSARLRDRRERRHGVGQDLANALMPGASYEVRAFGRVRGTASDELALSARIDCQGRLADSVRLHSAIGHDDAWTPLAGILTLPPGEECSLSEALVFVHGPAAGVELLLDDVSIVPR